MNNAESTLLLVCKGIHIEFYREPDLDAINEARKLLDQITDEIIRKNINEH